MAPSVLAAGGVHHRGQTLIRARVPGVAAQGRLGVVLMVRGPPPATMDDDHDHHRPPPTQPASRPRAPGATATPSQPIIGGVAAGLAAPPRRCPVLWVRAAFLVAAVLGGFGVAVLRRAVAGAARRQPLRGRAPRASRARPAQGRRPGRIRAARATPGPAIALVALGLGVVLTAEAIFGSGVAVLAGRARPSSASGCCGARPTRRSASAGSTSPSGSTRSGPSSAPAAGRRTLRVGAGVVLIVAAAGAVRRAPAATFARCPTCWSRRRSACIGLGDRRSARGSGGSPTTSRAERAERVRTQERADIAAHLHDSVLQTLALIQRNAADAADGRPAGPRRRSATCAPGCSTATPTDGGTLAGALREVVRRGRGHATASPSSVVTSATRPSTSRCARSSRAAREAMVNAAKHAGRRPGRRLRRGRAGPRSRCSSATAAPASTRDAVPGRPAGRARQHRGPDGAGTAAPPRSAPRPATGTEVRLQLPRSDATGDADQ